MKADVSNYESTIFTTGAFLKPIKIKNKIKEIWVWCVSEFIDDSYKDGKIFNPIEYSNNKESLLKEII